MVLMVEVVSPMISFISFIVGVIIGMAGYKFYRDIRYRIEKRNFYRSYESDK